jgi:hypothetical protein
MSAQPREEVEAGSSRTVTVGGEPDTLRFDPPRDDAQRGAAQAEGEAGRHVSAALMASPVSLASAGATPSVAQPREEVEADARSRRKIAPPVTSEPEADSSRVVTVGGKPDTPRFDPLRADAQRGTAQADAEPVRPSSGALVASPHPLTSVGETQASTQLIRQLLSESRNEIAPAVERRGEIFSAERRRTVLDFVNRGALAVPVESVSSGFVAWVKADQEYVTATKDKDNITSPSHEGLARPVIAGAMVPKAQSILKALPTSMRRSADRQPPSSVQEVETEPVINVTIGRIEVRAVAEDSKASRRSHESRERKPMSLDEYLKQRGGGR